MGKGKSAVMVSAETAAELRKVARSVQAPSVGDLLRLVSGQHATLQRAYLEGLRAEIDARIQGFERRTASSGSARPPRQAAGGPSGAAAGGAAGAVPRPAAGGTSGAAPRPAAGPSGG